MSQELCKRVDEAMASLLDDEAPAELVEHIATCDRCRDARHDAALARGLVEAAGADYAHPDDFEARLLQRLDEAETEASDGDASAGVPHEGAPQSLSRPSEAGSTVYDEPALDGAGSTIVAGVDWDDPDEDHASKEPGAVGRAVDEAVTQPMSSRKPRKKKPSGGTVRWLRRPRNTIVTGLVAAALSAAAVGLLTQPDDTTEMQMAAEPWTGKVASVSRAGGGDGLELCTGGNCVVATEGAEVPPGAVLKTDPRTRARIELTDGSTLVLDRGSELSLDGDATRRASLKEGALVAEIAPRETQNARFDVVGGHVEVKGTKFALRARGDFATVDVVRGALALVDRQGQRVDVLAGQEGRLSREGAPEVSSAPSLSDALSWSETGEPSNVVRGLGELRAKKPGDKQEQQGAVRLTSHQVKVRIVDGFARTEVTEVFQNQTDQVLEGIYRFPLPPSAQIERLALEVDGKMEEGAFVDRTRAAAIWRGAIVNGAKKKVKPQEEIIWVPGPWKDPALLEWQRGGRFELRIFPIPRKGSRKVVLTYTEKVPATGGRRRYTYPLPHDQSGDLQVDDFRVDVQVRGHDDGAGVRSLGYAMADRSSSGVGEMTLAAQSFVPNGDLVVEYESAHRGREMTAWAYQPASTTSLEADAEADATPTTGGQDAKAAAVAEVTSDKPYLALSLRPVLGGAAAERQRAYAIVVDTSRSMMGERHRRATALATRLVQEMDRLDHFTVLACDTHCETIDAGWRTPGNAAAADVQQFLQGITPDGASDPAGVLREAAQRNPDGRKLEIVYIGDGTPTVGPVRPAVVTAALRDQIGADARITTVAVGADADADNLAVLARAGGGVALPYVPGQRENEVAYGILGATLGRSLRDVQVTLPAGVERVAPTQIDTVVAGGEVFVTARMTQPHLEGEVVLRGKLGDEPFERRYPLDVTASRSDGNAFVPRLYAAARIHDLERDGSDEAKTTAVALSSAFNVASRFTSLLVLESLAMFKAFGLDNQRRVATWTGDVVDEVGDEEALAGVDGSGKGDSATGGVESKKAKEKAPRLDADDLADSPYGSTAMSPPALSRPAPQPAPPPAAKPAMPSADPFGGGQGSGRSSRRWRPPPRRRMVPMRRIFVRQASVFPGRSRPLQASEEAILKARAEMEQNPNRRAAVQELYTLYARAGRVEDAARLADLWADKEALDPEALTARAEVAAAQGDREGALKRLGSVIDVRPGRLPAHRRLARAFTWAGRPQDACRHRVALAELKTDDGDLLADAVRCSRATGRNAVAEAMLRLASDPTRKAAERALTKPAKPDLGARGDVKVTATWSGGADLDLALVHPEGHRVCWLWAPTRAIISASDVNSFSTESLGLLGSPAGEYAIEVVRARPPGQGASSEPSSSTSAASAVSQAPISGEITVNAAGSIRKIPFTLVGDRLVVGTIQVSFRSQLVPIRRGWRR